MRYTTSTDHQCPACGYTERKSKKRSESVDAEPVDKGMSFDEIEQFTARVMADPAYPAIVHVVQVGSDRHPNECPECGRLCASSAGLSAHQRAAHKQAAEV